MDDAKTLMLKRMFYVEFVDFFSDRCTIMKRTVGADLQLPFRDHLYGYHVDELMMYQMPLGMTLFSIRISMHVADLNEVTAVLSSLRMIDYYRDEIHQPFIDAALMPVKKV